MEAVVAAGPPTTVCFMGSKCRLYSCLLFRRWNNIKLGERRFSSLNRQSLWDVWKLRNCPKPSLSRDGAACWIDSDASYLSLSTYVVIGKCDIENSIVVDSKNRKGFCLTGPLSHSPVDTVCEA